MSLLHLSRAETIDSRGPHDLAESAERALASVARLRLGPRRVETSFGSAPVTGDPAVLDRFVLTLVENACRYNTDGELVRVTTGVANGAAQLQIDNDGPALTAADVPALFERFHRGGAGSARARGDAQADGHGPDLPHRAPTSRAPYRATSWPRLPTP